MALIVTKRMAIAESLLGSHWPDRWPPGCAAIAEGVIEEV